MKKLILIAFCVSTLTSAAPAMASCKLNITGTVDASHFAGLDVDAFKAKLNDSLGYKATTNQLKDENQLSYSIIMNSNGNEAKVTLSFTTPETTVQHTSVVTSVFESRLDNQVINRFQAIVPRCDD